MTMHPKRKPPEDAPAYLLVTKKPDRQRKLEVTAAVCKRTFELAEDGNTNKTIAHVLGVTEGEFNARTADHPQLAAALEMGRAEGVASVRRALRKKALGGDARAVEMYLRMAGEAMKDGSEANGNGGAVTNNFLVLNSPEKRREVEAKADRLLAIRAQMPGWVPPGMGTVTIGDREMPDVTREPSITAEILDD